MKAIIFLACVIGLFSFTASGQVSNTFLGHMHYNGTKSNVYAKSLALAPDSTYTGIRPTATAAIGYNSKLGTTVMAFAGVGYFHVTHVSATDAFYTDYGISLQIGTGASNGSVSLTNATTVGLFGQFLNNLVTVGIGYNFSNKIGLPLVGPGIAFH